MKDFGSLEIIYQIVRLMLEISDKLFLSLLRKGGNLHEERNKDGSAPF